MGIYVERTVRKGGEGYVLCFLGLSPIKPTHLSPVPAFRLGMSTVYTNSKISRDKRNMLSMSFFVGPESPISSKISSKCLIFVQI